MRFDGQRIRNLREKYGHSLGMVCRLLEIRCGYKISRSTLCQWEHNRYLPNLKGLMAICELYGVEMNYFFPEI